MRDSGVTLVELLVVLSIIAVLIIAMGFSYQGWIGNYRIESMTKELYFDLSDARSLAMSRSRIHWVELEGQQYTITEDTDEDAVLDDPGDLQVRQRRYEYDYLLEAVGPGMPQTITLNSRGLMDWVPAGNQITFRFNNTRDPDYDCIVIETSKMWMGEFNTDLNVCERR